MRTEEKIKALAELDDKLFVIHKQLHDPFGYYRKDACGYTTLAEAWRVTEEVGLKYVGGRPADHDRVVLKPAPIKPYLTSYDAIIPLIRKQWKSTNTDEGVRWQFLFWNALMDSECMLFNSPAQLCEALLRALGKWKD